MPYGSIAADKITNSDGFTLGGSGASMKNRIINGAMVLDQRNAGASVTPSNGAYTLDRWSAFTNGAGVYTVGQSSTAPSGFKNSLLCTVTTIDSSVSGSDYYMLQHKIEGYNVGDLAWGSSDAKTVTLSFWVRSSITGTYAVKLGNADSDRSYVSTYTISSANTWEQKTITITGDTSGTWASTNGVGIEIRFAFAIGSTWTTSTLNSWQAVNYFGSTTASNNWIGTNGATFYITGVQLEKGSTATSFDYRPYGTELFLCQRYFWRRTGASNATFGVGQVYNTTDIRALLYNPVVMRTAPSITFTGSNFSYANSGSIKTLATLNAADQTPEVSLLYSGAGTTASTQGQAAFWLITSSASYIDVSAEL